MTNYTKPLKVVLLPLLFLFSFSISLAQTAKDYEYIGINNFPLSSESGKVTYEGVIEAEGQSAQDLYSTALLWLAKHHGNKGAITAQQPGEFIAGRFTVSTPDNTATKYDYLLEFKDGRYRYVLNNFVVLWSSGSSALETFFPAKIKNGKAAMIQDKNMQAMHAVFDTETGRLATIGEKKEDW